MNYLFEKAKSFYYENTRSIDKYTKYGICAFMLYCYPTVLLSVALTVLVFNKIEAEIKFNTDNILTVPRFNFEMVEIKKEKVDVSTSTEKEDIKNEKYESEDENPMSKSVIFDETATNEITSSQYKSQFK